MAILIDGKDGKNAFENALEMNSPRLVEMLLNALIQIPEFNLSRVLYQHFPKLFAMKIKSFEHYLESCFF